MIDWGVVVVVSNGFCFLRLRSALGPDIILGCYCYYEPFFGASLFWVFTRGVALRWVFSGYPYSYSLLYFTFSVPLHRVSCLFLSYFLPAPDWVK